MDIWSCAPSDLLCCFDARVEGNRLLQCLGEGGQARVYRLHDGRINPHTGETMGPIAVKCYPRKKLSEREINQKRVLREIMNHRRLCHKHIVGFREVRLTRNYLLIALNYVRGRSLFHKIESLGGPLCEDSARWCFRQLILAVDYLHRQNVANRDISLENILINETGNEEVSIMLCDLGLSRSKFSLENNGTRSIVGKKGYMAPEGLMRMDRKSFALAAAGDIYACGVCLYKMLAGLDRWPLLVREPLDTTSLQDLLVKLACATQERDLDLEGTGIHLSPGCIGFLRKILHTNPTQRITMHEIWHNDWFMENIPLHQSREYNDTACSEQYLAEHFSCLQSEIELRSKVQKASSNYELSGSWE